ncbi:hypothetical protein GFS24_07405 [Chitinophaga sp. SYP-B3965]|uniref:tetratricopeptide repeat protein n=1 Tax=Chitinophaga sp. SYP-B3965 TaxID=2663120 RepID=UPI001299A8E3|nr:hypothetical protein [Chitinophaga sp. SYP-B3965]MRG44934.1 hypothetical protein [Chitinophaga sp. SYP-B3965]
MLRTIALLIILFASCKAVPEKVTKEEALAAANRLEEMVLSRNPEGLAAFFEKDAFVKLVISKSRAAKEENMKTFNITPALTNLAKTTIQAAENGSFRFLRQYEKDGQQHVLFRLTSEGGFNYMDFYLVKVKNTVKAEDLYSYSTGGTISTTLADAFDAMSPKGASSSDSKRMADSVLAMQAKRKRGDFEGVKEQFERLPAELQKDKGVMLFYIDACKNISDAEYKMSLEKFSESFPDAPNSYLMLIDAYIMAEEYDKVLAAVNKIDSLVGRDHYLDYFRGNVYRMMGKPAESKASYEKAYAKGADLADNVQSLLIAYMEDNETEKAEKVIAEYKTSKWFNQPTLDIVYASYPQLKK